MTLEDMAKRGFEDPFYCDSSISVSFPLSLFIEYSNE